MRFSFVDAFNKGIERLLVKYIPGYSMYKAMAEDKLHQRTGTLPYASVLVRGDLGWQPAFLIEQDVEGRCVLFVPRAPDTSAGSVLLATRINCGSCRRITANQLEASLKTMGKGLLDHVVPRLKSRMMEAQRRTLLSVQAEDAALYDGITGQVAVSRYVLRIGNPSGATVREASKAERPHVHPPIRARSSPPPIDSRPARSPGRNWRRRSRASTAACPLK